MLIEEQLSVVEALMCCSGLFSRAALKLSEQNWHFVRGRCATISQFRPLAWQNSEGRNFWRGMPKS